MAASIITGVTVYLAPLGSLPPGGKIKINRYTGTIYKTTRIVALPIM